VCLLNPKEFNYKFSSFPCLIKQRLDNLNFAFLGVPKLANGINLKIKSATAAPQSFIAQYIKNVS
jgi:hypothetical protein